MATKKVYIGPIGPLLFDDASPGRKYGIETDGKSFVAEAPGSNQEVARLADIGAGSIPLTVIDAKGDLIVGTGDDAVDNLPVGADGQVLTADSALAMGVKWAAPGGGGIPETLIDAKGDLIIGLADDTAGKLASPLPATGQIIVSDDIAPEGAKWIPRWDIINAKGDLIVGLSNDTVNRLAVGGTDGMILEVKGSVGVGMQWTNTLKTGTRIESGSVPGAGDPPAAQDSINWGITAVGLQFSIYHESTFDNAHIAALGNTLVINSNLSNAIDPPVISLGKLGEINIEPLTGKDAIVLVGVGGNKFRVVGPATIDGRLIQETFGQLKAVGPISTPPTGYGFLYNNPLNGKAFWRDDGGVDYDLTAGAGSGDVVGPAGATDNAIARFDTATGKLIQNSLVTVSDTAIIARPSAGVITLSGQTVRVGGGANTHFEVDEDGDILRLKALTRIEVINTTRVSDDIILNFGLHDDLRIFHDNSGTPANRVQLLASRDLVIQGVTGAPTGGRLATFSPGGAVELFHNNTLCVTTFSGGGLKWGNAIPALFGAGNEMQILFDNAASKNSIKTGLTKLEIMGTAAGTEPLLTVDPTNQRVGINQTTPAVELEVRDAGGSPGTIRAGHVTRAVGTLVIDGQAVQLGSAANQFRWDESSGEVSIRGNSVDLLIPRADGVDSLNQAINFQTIANPVAPVNAAEMRLYFRAQKAVIQYNDAGTVRYITMALNGTGARSWTTSITQP